MNPRRTHSSIDNLPAELQKALEQMLIDNLWPFDFPGKTKGKPKYKDLEIYCMHRGYPVSKSAIGRFGMRMRVLAQMKNSGLIVREVMKDIDSENISQTQKALCELLTAKAIETACEKKLSPMQIMLISKASKDCADVAIKAEKYRQQQTKQKAEQAVKNIETKLDKNISPETLKIIREQIYGIV